MPGMVEISEIRGRDNLKAWLADKPPVVRAAIAVRAAQRVLPLWWRWVLTDRNARDRDLTVLHVARIVLTSSVSTKSKHSDSIVDAAIAAGKAAYAAAYADLDHDLARDRNQTDFIVAAEAAYKAATASDDVFNAANAAANASIAYAGADAAAGSQSWVEVRGDAKAFEADIDIMETALWTQSDNPFLEVWNDIQKLTTELSETSPNTDWSFWIAWYQSLLDGTPMLEDGALTWAMLERIARIEPRDWDAGPETVNPMINNIWGDYRQKNEEANEEPETNIASVSATEVASIAQRAVLNRDAIVVSVKGLQEQLVEFKERFRGDNHLEPEVRDELLDFIDMFSSKLDDLLANLPLPGESVSDDQANRLALWLRGYKASVTNKLADYLTYDNVAEATIPTGFVCFATAIGAMLGNPGAGMIAGSLLVRNMKPGQAAKEIMAPKRSEGDGG